MGPNVKAFLAIRRGGGGLGGPSIRLGPTCFYKYTYKIWNQSVQDFISYRIHKDFSVDPDAAADATMIKP